MAEERYRLDQFIGVKQVQRELPQLLERLEAGQGPLVLTRRGKAVAMLTVLPIEQMDIGGEGG